MCASIVIDVQVIGSITGLSGGDNQAVMIGDDNRGRQIVPDGVLTVVLACTLGPQAAADSRHNLPLERIADLLRQHSGERSSIEHELQAATVRNVLLHNLADYCHRLQDTPECDQDYRPAFIASLIGSITAILSSSAESINKTS